MARAEYRISKGCFQFHNENPKGSVRACDCVVRAISKALGKKWEDTVLDLTMVGIKLGDVLNAKATYKKYLEGLGYKMKSQPRKPDRTKYTITEFAQENPRGTFIIGVANHLTVVVDGVLYDTWDCSGKSVGNYWIVK